MSDPEMPGPLFSPPEQPDDEDARPLSRLHRLLVGGPRDLFDRSIFHRIALVPFLAWVGLGADGLSSSCYGPEEAFKTLGENTYLAIGLALVMATTVFVIAIAYSRVIENFPHGGGGYVVATKLLGSKAGVVSGSALLVDYVLTITISIAASGDALFSFLPMAWHPAKLWIEVGLIAILTVLNFRGVRESVLVMTPIFLVFVATHLVLIAGGIIAHAPDLPETMREAGDGFSSGMTSLGLGGMVLLFIHAYSLGGGTYTGIEAVSNGLAIMREPRVQTGKRTMFYMAASLAFTASGLLLCYLLWDVSGVEGKTMNAVLVEQFVKVVPLGSAFVVLTLFSEGALLVVAAQAGFVDGPRVLANMATDAWVPRRFAALSDRLTTQNGILLMGLAALAALLYTRGNVRQIVVMYSINVFLTFSMTETAMCSKHISERKSDSNWIRKIRIHVIGLTMCLTILVVTVFEKFAEGGWITLLVTGSFVALCFLIKGHYNELERGFQKLNKDLAGLEQHAGAAPAPPKQLDRSKPTAVMLVSSYGGLGIHTLLHLQRAFGGHFGNLVFVSVGVIDSGGFKGAGAVEALQASVEEMLGRYVSLAERLGWPATFKMSIATDVVSEAERLCIETSREFDRCVFFTGQVIFQRDRWYQRVLHNQTAFAIQKRLQWNGMTMVILPVRVQI